MADLSRLQSAQEIQIVSEFGPIQVYRNLNLTNAGSTVKNSPGVLLGWNLFNTNATVRWVKFYDKATPPLTGVDTAKLTIPVANISFAPFNFPHGIPFANWIGISATANLPDSDNTAPPANNIIIVTLFYA
jgi:hypothetical protein